MEEMEVQALPWVVAVEADRMCGQALLHSLQEVVEMQSLAAAVAQVCPMPMLPREAIALVWAAAAAAAALWQGSMEDPIFMEGVEGRLVLAAAAAEVEL